MWLFNLRKHNSARSFTACCFRKQLHINMARLRSSSVCRRISWQPSTMPTKISTDFTKSHYKSTSSSNLVPPGVKHTEKSCAKVYLVDYGSGSVFITPYTSQVRLLNENFLKTHKLNQLTNNYYKIEQEIHNAQQIICKKIAQLLLAFTTWRSR